MKLSKEKSNYYYYYYYHTTQGEEPTNQPTNQHSQLSVKFSSTLPSSLGLTSKTCFPITLKTAISLNEGRKVGNDGGEVADAMVSLIFYKAWLDRYLPYTIKNGPICP